MLFKLKGMGKGQMYTGIYQCLLHSYLRQGKMREKLKHLQKELIKLYGIFTIKCHESFKNADRYALLLKCTAETYQISLTNDTTNK